MMHALADDRPNPAIDSLPSPRRFFSNRVAILTLAPLLAPALSHADPQRWKTQVDTLVAADEAMGITPGVVVFTGSSTVRLWATAAAFPDLPHVNRAIGGSQFPDVLFWADKLILPHQPRLVVIYCGTNDVNAGANADEVMQRYHQFTSWMDEHLPETDLLFITIKPTLARWDKWPLMQEINQRVIADAAEHDRRHAIDVTTAMLNEDGEPEAAYLSSDGLHLGDKGYEALKEVVAPAVDALIKQPL